MEVRNSTCYLRRTITSVSRGKGKMVVRDEAEVVEEVPHGPLKRLDSSS